MLVIAIVGLSFWKSTTSKSGQNIKIGIVTDLTGPAAYWGESSQIGAQIAKTELEKEGYKVDLIFEDYQLDPQKALTSAQKLVEVDGVDGLYAEFNPAAVSIGSYIKDKNTLFVYDAAVVSPLKDNTNAFKTYLDYQAGCQAVAEKYKQEGITKVGSLKINLEAGELCQAGVEKVYGKSMFSQSYNLGDTDFKTQMLKFKNNGVEAIIESGFEGDTLTALKALKELDYKIPYSTTEDNITENVKKQYGDMLTGSWTYGFKSVDPSFVAKIKLESSKSLATDYGAALAYTHVKQMVKSLDTGAGDPSKVSKIMADSPEDNTIRFNKFDNRIADLTMLIKKQ